MRDPLLRIKNLSVSIHEAHETKILQSISLTISPGEVLGLVGESGCGKSMTANAILRLLPQGAKSSGEIDFLGYDLLNASAKELSAIRGQFIGLVLQDPSTSLNPLMKIGKQLTEALRYHKKISSNEAHQRALQWLCRVGITDPKYRLEQYPHELSGGMKQRILIAQALMCQPQLLIADEPTTALDMTTQLVVLELLKKLQEEEDLALLLITHDLGVVANYCKKVAVMYAGRLVEMGDVSEVFSDPRHPYTAGLIASQLSSNYPKNVPLKVLEGTPPVFTQEFLGCPFYSRCPYKKDLCLEKFPLKRAFCNREVFCWFEGDIT